MPRKINKYIFSRTGTSLVWICCLALWYEKGQSEFSHADLWPSTPSRCHPWAARQSKVFKDPSLNRLPTTILEAFYSPYQHVIFFHSLPLSQNWSDGKWICSRVSALVDNGNLFSTVPSASPSDAVLRGSVDLSCCFRGDDVLSFPPCLSELELLAFLH